ncbi:hypothetical protein TNCT_684551 [Trichonephila clavata]|uniref:Uncharacterized protein n=1 Tax=Trichonephila clavata TaxID=2740835 RepID=A0A8X6HA59_TRICU|nr:hypothetical protein TNCT_684551 [Trichonephila clavata]
MKNNSHKSKIGSTNKWMEEKGRKLQEIGGNDMSEGFIHLDDVVVLISVLKKSYFRHGDYKWDSSQHNKEKADGPKRLRQFDDYIPNTE